MSVDLTDSDADSGAATLKRAGLQPEDVGDEGVLVRVTADWGTSVKFKQADGASGSPDAEALANFALAIGDASEQELQGDEATQPAA